MVAPVPSLTVSNTRFNAPTPRALPDGTVTADGFNVFMGALRQWAVEVDRFMGTTDLSEVYAELADIEAEIDVIDAAIVNLDADLTTAEAAIAANADDIAAINANLANYVPTTRTLTPSGSIRIDGGTSAVDLSANRTIGVVAAGEGTFGTVQLVDATTINSTASSPLYAATPNQLINALRTSATYQSTTTQRGAVELATNAETETGTDATRATTPAGVTAALAPLVDTFAAFQGEADNAGIPVNTSGSTPVSTHSFVLPITGTPGLFFLIAACTFTTTVATDRYAAVLRASGASLSQDYGEDCTIYTLHPHGILASDGTAAVLIDLSLNRVSGTGVATTIIGGGATKVDWFFIPTS